MCDVVYRHSKAVSLFGKSPTQVLQDKSQGYRRELYFIYCLLALSYGFSKVFFSCKFAIAYLHHLRFFKWLYLEPNNSKTLKLAEPKAASSFKHSGRYLQDTSCHGFEFVFYIKSDTKSPVLQKRGTACSDG